MIINVAEKINLENLSNENPVDEIERLLKSITSTMDKILQRNKQGFEELYRKGIYVQDREHKNSY